jgi:hypothetical protein
MTMPNALTIGASEAAAVAGVKHRAAKATARQARLIEARAACYPREHVYETYEAVTGRGYFDLPARLRYAGITRGEASDLIEALS